MSTEEELGTMIFEKNRDEYFRVTMVDGVVDVIIADGVTVTDAAQHMFAALRGAGLKDIPGRGAKHV